MAFFLIVPSVMIAGVLVVHALANRMGLRIYYGTLIAAVLAAFAADFATVLVSPAVGKGFFLRLGIFVLAAAAVLTAANIFFVKRKRTEEKNFNEEVRAAYRAEVEKTSAQADDKTVDATADVVPVENFEWTDPATGDAVTPVTVDAKEAAPEVESPPAQVEAVEAEVSDDDKPAQSTEVSSSDEDAKSPEEFPLEEVFKPLESVPIEKLERFAREEKKSHPAPEPKSSEVFPYEEVFKPLESVKPETIEKIQDEEKSSPHEKSPELEEKI